MGTTVAITVARFGGGVASTVTLAAAIEEHERLGPYDALGQPIPEHLVGIFANWKPELEAMEKSFRKAATRSQDIANENAWLVLSSVLDGRKGASRTRPSCSRNPSARCAAHRRRCR